MKKLATLLALFVLLLSVFAFSRPAHAQGAEWTFMVYLDADNDLEDVGIDNFLAMAKVGSTDDLRIVVQFDRIAGYDTRYGDWTTTKRFLVTKDMSPTAANATQDLGEMNMADPATLVSFVTWATSTYPAEHYFLDIWDHGMGWEGVALDDAPVGNDVMSAVELGTALQQIKASLGRPLDIIANDACRMSLEIMYQARKYATYMVGSEKDEPVEGWPYDLVLGELAAHPTMAPVQLAQTLVDKYIESYSPPNLSSYSVAMALVDSSALPPVVTALNNFVSAVNFTLPYSEKHVDRARNLTEHYESNQCNIRMNGNDFDLYDVATNLAAKIPYGRLKITAVSLQTAIRKAVIYEKHLNVTSAVNCVWADKAYGLALWYPSSMGSRKGLYEGLDLSRDSLWDEYLDTYRNVSSKSVSFVSSLTLSDRNQDGINDTAVLHSISSENGTVFVDALLDDSLLSNISYDSPAAAIQMKTIPLAHAGFCSFYLLFHQPEGTMNVTAYSNVAVNATLLVRGVVRGGMGEPLDGISVKVTNPRTNESLSTTTSQGIYSFSLTYPQWLRNGDDVTLDAEDNGATTRHTFTLSYSGQRYMWIDLRLERNGRVTDSSIFGQYWFILLIPAAGMIIVVCFLGFLVMIAHKRKPRG